MKLMVRPLVCVTSNKQSDPSGCKADEQTRSRAKSERALVQRAESRKLAELAQERRREVQRSRAGEFGKWLERRVCSQLVDRRMIWLIWLTF